MKKLLYSLIDYLKIKLMVSYVSTYINLHIIGLRILLLWEQLMVRIILILCIFILKKLQEIL